MKRRPLIVAAFVAMIVIAYVVWCWMQPSPTRNQPKATEAELKTHSSTRAPDAAVPVTPPQKLDRPIEPKRDIAQRVLENLNHKNIEFYGRVLDQNGQPVSGVNVYASVIYNTGMTAGTARKETTTDASGTFTIQGMSGRTLGIGLEKEGYEYGGGQGPFHYTDLVSAAERHYPDSKNPVLFHLWKLQGPEPLVQGDKNFRLPHDGTPVRIALTTGKVASEGGDLEIVLHCEQLQQGEYKEFAWNAEIRAPNGGGLIDPEQIITAMFSAPPEGYDPKLRIGSNANPGRWNGGGVRTFYLKTGSGNYAKVWADFHPSPQDATGFVTLRWWFNPKVGSRVLEPKQTEQPLNH